ncbi:MAG: hypothetical protein M1814_004159 [Vezdaea aestivalis]|nr:MAG: hypothetical protein M1814_004159 [Vezdaea aestivalis]
MSALEDIKETVNGFILDPANAELLAILKGARNGLVYGAKVRFPHALVMVFLFRKGSLRNKIGLILKATRQHAKNLALFATVYKSACLALKKSRPSGKETSSDTFLAGLLGGYLVFGRGMQSSVNQQIIVYIFARVMLGLAKLSIESGVVQDKNGKIRSRAWPVFASLSWAGVMWLFRWYPETLQPSLRSSMKYM